SGYDYIEVDRHLVPPPMRSIPWDCAIRPAGDEFVEDLLPDGGYAQSVQYSAFYVGMTFDELVAFYRAWESSGWADVGEINIVDDGQGRDPGISAPRNWPRSPRSPDSSTRGSATATTPRARPPAPTSTSSNGPTASASSPDSASRARPCPSRRSSSPTRSSTARDWATRAP